MSRHVDGTFYAAPPPPSTLNWPLRLIYVPLRCFFFFFYTANKENKVSTNTPFLFFLVAGNDIHFRLTALQRVYLFHNKWQGEGVQGAG